VLQAGLARWIESSDVDRAGTRPGAACRPHRFFRLARGGRRLCDRGPRASVRTATPRRLSWRDRDAGIGPNRRATSPGLSAPDAPAHTCAVPRWSRPAAVASPIPNGTTGRQAELVLPFPPNVPPAMRGGGHATAGRGFPSARRARFAAQMHQIRGDHACGPTICDWRYRGPSYFKPLPRAGAALGHGWAKSVLLKLWFDNLRN